MDLTIPEPVANLKTMVATLGEKRLRPLGIEADRRGAALPSDHPFFREVLGFGLTGGIAGPLEKREDDGKERTSTRRAVVLAEEAAYWDRGMATSLPGPGLGGAPVMMMGTPTQKQRLLGMFEKPTEPRWAAFAMSEPGAGSDVAAIRTRARKHGDHWVLDGEKMFISNGARASWVVVWATIDPQLGREGHRAFVVERGSPGFRVARVDKKMGLAASETASLVFEGCEIPDDNLLQGREGGFKSAMATFNVTRPIVAAMAIGIGRAALDEARRFAREHFTGAASHRLYRVRDKLGAIRRRLEAGRLLAWRAAWLADRREPNAVEASIAKAYCPPIALEAASLGIEILGEAGAATDHLIEKLFRDVKVLDIVEGTGQIQRLVMARALVNHGANHE